MRSILIILVVVIFVSCNAKKEIWGLTAEDWKEITESTRKKLGELSNEKWNAKSEKEKAEFLDEWSPRFHSDQFWRERGKRQDIAVELGKIRELLLKCETRLIEEKRSKK